MAHCLSRGFIANRDDVCRHPKMRKKRRMFGDPAQARDSQSDSLDADTVVGQFGYNLTHYGDRNYS